MSRGNLLRVTRHWTSSQRIRFLTGFLLSCSKFSRRWTSSQRSRILTRFLLSCSKFSRRWTSSQRSRILTGFLLSCSKFSRRWTSSQRIMSLTGFLLSCSKFSRARTRLKSLPWACVRWNTSKRLLNLDFPKPGNANVIVQSCWVQLWIHRLKRYLCMRA